jgi:hypothetical protein
MRNMPAKLSKIKIFGFWIFILMLDLCIFNFNSYAAPCYGTNMPGKNGLDARLESYSIFNRNLEKDYGDVRSQQEFYGMSYGVFDWFSIDLKAGFGYIKHSPESASDLDYNTSFAGGYGLRLKLYDKNNIKAVFGFQHISVHPHSTHVGDVKNKAILDDWQTSLLASYSFKRLTPYLGTRWSRVDYIHKVGDDRKRKMSDLGESFGLICGLDVPITDKIWINLEGSALDGEAFSGSINYKF